MADPVVSFSFIYYFQWQKRWYPSSRKIPAETTRITFSAINNPITIPSPMKNSIKPISFSNSSAPFLFHWFDIFYAKTLLWMPITDFCLIFQAHWLVHRHLFLMWNDLQNPAPYQESWSVHPDSSRWQVWLFHSELQVMEESPLNR